MKWPIEDGNVYSLQNDDYSLFMEFIDTNGRISIRLYDRFGKGLLITHSSMITMHEIISSALDKYETIAGLEHYDGRDDQVPRSGIEGSNNDG